METIKLSELFDIEHGKSYFNEFIEDDNGVNYITTSGQNQGIKCKVAKNDKYKIYPAGTITVALQGSTMSAFVQIEDFILQTHVAVLTPKEEMTLNEKLYYCMCIQANAFKFSYGRKANTTFSDLLIPAEIPDWVYTAEAPDIEPYKDQIDKYLRDENGKLTIKPDKLYDLIKSGFFDKNEPFTNNPTPELNTDNWKEFKYEDIFDIIMIGKSIDLNKLDEGDINYVGRTEENNGITAKVAKYNNQEPYEGNCITVPMVGNALKSTYQNSPFYVSQNILILRSRNLNKYNAMFFNVIIRMDEFRFCYGRTLSIDRFKQLTIKLPTTPEGEPDYQFMEDYIKTLPYSKYI